MKAAGRVVALVHEGISVLSADPSEGTLTPYSELKSSISLAPVVANQTLYVLDDSGTITAYR